METSFELCYETSIISKLTDVFSGFYSPTNELTLQTLLLPPGRGGGHATTGQ